MTAARILERARSARVLVVGDICLDRWCRYEPSLAEASVETGIPRVAVTATDVTPGGGGTVAGVLAGLRAGRVSVLGVVGRDGFGSELKTALAERGIDGRLLVETDEAQTFTYTKLVNAETEAEDLPRVDFVNAEALPAAVEAEVLERFRGAVGEADAVVVADQAETDRGGVVSERLREAVCREAARRPESHFLADSRRRIHLFRNVIATPNRIEADLACSALSEGSDYGRLRRRLGGPALVVSAGERGAWLADESGTRLIDACRTVEPVDTCGAGDSLTAGMALALAAGAGVEDALRFGIIVAGVTVGKRGTGSASPDEVLAVAGSTASRGW